MDDVEAKLEQDPGDPIFAEYGESLRKEAKLDRALEVLMAGLSESPGNHKGRLVLAHVLYQKEYYPFAVRELEQLHRAVPQNRSIRKLLEKLAPGSVAEAEDQIAAEPSDSESQDTIAEADFDFDMLDMVDSDDED